MLQVLRAPATAPSLERRVRRMVVAQPRSRHGTLEPDMLLGLVAHQRRHTRRALARLSALLRGQALQARISPGSHRISPNVKSEERERRAHQSKRGRSLMASSIDTKRKGAVPALARTARAISPFGKRTSRRFAGGKSCVGCGAAGRVYPRRAAKRKKRTRVCGVP
jgi:hypothetical protein